MGLNHKKKNIHKHKIGGCALAETQWQRYKILISLFLSAGTEIEPPTILRRTKGNGCENRPAVMDS